MDFPQKVFCGVFELPWLRNAQKRHKKPSICKEKKREVPTYPSRQQVDSRFPVSEFQI
jgi:hypothetical protein